jgi:hypothetical protein
VTFILPPVAAPFRDDAKPKQLTTRHKTHYLPAKPISQPPSPRFLNRIDAPPIAIGPLYAAKTIQQCISDDPVCSMDGSNIAAHGEYVANGMVDQAADFVAQRLLAPPPGPLPSGPVPGPAPPALPLGG